MAWEKISESNQELKQSLELKDNFANKRHDEKKELIILRQSYALDLITLRDRVSAKRHAERIELLDKKFNGVAKQ